MKQSNVHFREIQRSDYKALEKIIRDTWNYERFCSPDSANRMSKLFLASCLANQTFTCVAERDGEAVGIIMGKNEKKHRTPLRYTIRQIGATASMFCTKERRQVFKFFYGIDKLDSALLAQSGQVFDGELAFFAVRSDQRGTGIGKELFNKLLDYLKSQSIRNFYLYTDNTCNFGFYEHQGMKRIGEQEFNLQPYSNEDVQFFLYGYNLEKEADNHQ